MAHGSYPNDLRHHGQLTQPNRKGHGVGLRHRIESANTPDDALEAFKRTYATGYYRLRQMPTKEELDFLSGRM